MEKYSEVIDLPVICIDNGKKIGVVRDIIFCPQKREVKALLLENKSYQIGKRVIQLKDIAYMGRDAVVVKDCSCVKSLKKLDSAGEMKDKGEIRGLKIYTKTGRDLGIVKDVLFDYKTGHIDGVEVSDGLIQDIVLGRNILPLFGKVEFGKENIIVGREAAEEMTETGGGIRNYLK